MSYAVVRVQKMTVGSVGGIQIHDRREKRTSNTNPDIKYELSYLNYDLCPAQNVNFPRAVKTRIDSLDLPRAVRKDAIVLAQVLVTSDHDYFMGKDPRPFFEAAYDFLADRYGRENVISATVHMDEQTPHMHFNFVPVTEDGRLSAKSVLTKQSLTDQQTAFYEQVGKNFGLLRGEPRQSEKRRQHFETAEFKAYAERLSDLKESIGISEFCFQDDKNRLDFVQRELDAANQKLDVTSQAVQDAEERLDDMKSEIEINQGYVIDAQKAAQEQDNILNALDRRMNDTSVDLDRMEQSLADATRKAQKVKGSIDSLTEQKTALQGEIDALKTERDSLTAKEVEALKGERTVLGGLKGVTYKEFEALKRTAAKVDTMSAEREVALSRADQADARADAAEVHAKEACSAEMEALKKSNASLQEALQQQIDRTRQMEQAVRDSWNKEREIEDLKKRARRLFDDQQQTIDGLKEQVRSLTSQLEKVKDDLKSKIERACEVITGLVKASGMLKYDRKKDAAGNFVYGKYGVPDLSTEQEKLIDGLCEYGVGWAIENNFPENADEMQKRVSLSSDIKKIVEPPEPQPPKRAKGWEIGD